MKIGAARNKNLRNLVLEIAFNSSLNLRDPGIAGLKRLRAKSM
jgi:hypothetical protein